MITVLVVAALIVVGVFFGILGFIRLGYRLGQKAKSEEGASGEAAFGVVGGALLGLLGLILGFSFSGAQSRVDFRRQLVVQEANAIGTAYLRLDLLRPEDQPALRDLFREYTDLRLREHLAHSSFEELDQLGRQTIELQGKLWKAIVPACEATKEPPLKGVILPPVNEMIDLTTTQSIARRTHMPAVTLLLLIALALLSGLVVGRAMSGMPRQHMLISIVYATAITVTIYVILDLGMPRLGLIRMDFVNDAIREVRQGME